MRAPGSYNLHGAFRTANAATFLFSTSGAFFLLLPVYLHEIGSSPAQIGLVAGLLRASSLFARPLAGRLLDRIGRRTVIATGSGLAILAVLSLFIFSRVSGPFLAMRILQGVGTSLVDSGLGAVVADLSPPGARAQVFAIYTVWINLASAVMPGVGELIARRLGFFPVFGAAAGALAGGLLLAGRLPETARPPRDEPTPLRDLVGDAAPALLGGMVVGLAYGTLSVFVPVARIAATPGRVGMFFFAYFTGLIAIRLAGGLGLSWLVLPESLLPAFGLMAAGLGALPLGTSPVLLVTVGLACGASHGVVMPILYSLLLFGMPRDRRGWGVTLLAAAFDLGVVAGTTGLGLMAERLGYRGIFALAAGAVAVGASVAHRWSRR